METNGFKVYLNNITFNDGSTFEFSDSDIVVFTGANNSGKSQVLRDIMSHYENRDSKPIVVNTLEDTVFGGMEDIIKQCLDKNGELYYKNLHISAVRNLEYFLQQKIYNNIYRIFLKYLKTTERLEEANTVNSFNPIREQPSNPIQCLYLDDVLELTISNLFHQAFNQELIINKGGGNSIMLHVGTRPKLMEGEDRVSTSYLKRLSELPLIENQGDGMRSYAGILLNTFTSQDSITLIDEPEAFLHPPQARLLGKMLVKNTPNKRQLFISTHSEDFLKGLLDSDDSRIKIVRIDRKDNINYMKLLGNTDIKAIWEDPILRFSNILSGLFHSKVVVCEADTDCLFYQSVLNAQHDGKEDISPDILFTHCGGKQRLKVVVRALKSLDVKAVVITDIDILNDKNTFKELIESLGMPWETVESDWKSIFEYSKQQRPQLELRDVKQGLNTILDSITTPYLEKKDIDELRKVIKQSTAWSKIKEVGKSFFTGEAYSAFCHLSTLCKNNGLFIVPVGELECFYKLFSGHGTQWVNHVLNEVDLKTDPELKEARQFMEEISNF